MTISVGGGGGGGAQFFSLQISHHCPKVGYVWAMHFLAHGRGERRRATLEYRDGVWDTKERGVYILG